MVRVRHRVSRRLHFILHPQIKYDTYYIKKIIQIGMIWKAYRNGKNAASAASSTRSSRMMTEKTAAGRRLTRRSSRG